LQPPILLPLIEEQERFNSLECKGSYSATSNNIKMVHWLLVGGLLAFGTAMRGLGRVAAHPGPSSLY